MKICADCKIDKPFSDYWYSRGYPQAYCKPCKKLRNVAWSRKAGKEYYYKYKPLKEKIELPVDYCKWCEKEIPDGLMTMKANLCKDCRLAREFSDPSVRERRNEYSRNYRKENGIPERDIKSPEWKAKKFINRQVKRGVIVREPCVVCGLTIAHAHHEDYTKKNEVIWLCASHHKLHHTRGGIL